MQACSLKFCTAIERPAPIRLCAAVLQQRVHRHHEIAADGAEQDQEGRGDPGAADDVRGRSPARPCAMPSGITRVAWSSRMRIDATHRADGGADGHDADQRRAPASWCSRGATRGPGEARCTRRLPETPQNSVVVASEIWPSLSLHRRALQCREVADAGQPMLRTAAGCSGALGARDAQVEERGDHVDARRCTATAASGAVRDAGVDERQVERTAAGATRRGRAAGRRAAMPRMIDSDRQALDPAVGLDQLRGRQQLGEDAVLGRRVGRGAEADDGVARAADCAPNSIIRQPTTLMAFDDEHDLALGHGVGKGADQRREQHVEEREHRHQRRRRATQAAPLVFSIVRSRRRAMRCPPAS